MHQRETLRELAVAAASAAGELVARAHAGPGTLTAEVKSPGDYVTEVDRSAEQAAIRVLREGAPDIAILAEESGGTPTQRMWVIDPVDGTTNFVRGFPVVGVSVALVEDGRPVVGAVVAPLLGESWSAAEGQGAKWIVRDAGCRSRPTRERVSSPPGFRFAARSVCHGTCRS